MRILHLSDLHIGKKLHLYDLKEEQRDFLEQVIHTIEQEQVDVLLLAGDIYDKSIPSAEAVTVLDDFLTRVSGLEKTCEVIMISGNHDSAERMSYAGKLLRACHIHIVTNVKDCLKPIVLEDEYGEVNFYAIPFVKPASIRNAWEEVRERTNLSYDEAMHEVINRMQVNEAVRNVALSHQLFLNHEKAPEFSESESVTVGGLDQIQASLLDAFDYVALGHIHKGQCVGRDTMRYCGTPFKYSVSEASQEKGMLLIDMKEKGSISIRTIPITPLRDVKVLKGSLEELTCSSARSGEAVCDDYVSVELTDEDEVWMPQDRLKQAFPHLLEWKRANMPMKDWTDGQQTIDLTLGIDTLFADFYEAMNGQSMKEEQRKTIQALLEEE